jgi:hypothetical protein
MLFILRVSKLYEIRGTFLVLDHAKSHGGNNNVCEGLAKNSYFYKEMSIFLNNKKNCRYFFFLLSATVLSRAFVCF